MNCFEVVEKLSDFLDEDARRDLCREIEDHLSHCVNCRVEVDTVRKTIVLYQGDRDVRVPATLDSRLAAAMSLEYRRAQGRSPSD